MQATACVKWALGAIIVGGLALQAYSAYSQPRETSIYPTECSTALVHRINEQAKPPYEYVLCETRDGRKNVLFTNDAYPTSREWEEVGSR